MKMPSKFSKVCATVTKPRVQILDAALESAVEMSDRYITGRALPDKAIDVIDEAGARIRLRSMTKPPNLAELEEQIERLSIQKDEAVKNAEYEEAPPEAARSGGRLRAEEDMQKQWREKSKEVDGVVDEEVIAEVVSKMTGVPLTRLEKEEAQRLLELENELHKRVVSQDEAIKAISKTIRRARPQGCIVDGFVPVPRPLRRRQDAALQGARGVHVRRCVHHIQIDMSEYMEKHNVSRLIGARATSVMKKANRRHCVADTPAWCCSMKSRRPTPMSSTCSSRLWKKAG